MSLTSVAVPIVTFGSLATKEVFARPIDAILSVTTSLSGCTPIFSNAWPMKYSESEVTCMVHVFAASSQQHLSPPQAVLQAGALCEASSHQADAGSSAFVCVIATPSFHTCSLPSRSLGEVNPSTHPSP